MLGVLSPFPSPQKAGVHYAGAHCNKPDAVHQKSKSSRKCRKLLVVKGHKDALRDLRSQIQRRFGLQRKSAEHDAGRAPFRHDFPLSALYRIAKALGVPLTELLE